MTIEPLCGIALCAWKTSWLKHRNPVKYAVTVQRYDRCATLFADENGRTAHMVINLVLAQSEYSIAIPPMCAVVSISMRPRFVVAKARHIVPQTHRQLCH